MAEVVLVAQHQHAAAGGGDALALAAMRGRGEVDTSSQFESVRQAVGRFGGGSVSPWRHPQPPPSPPPLQLRPEEVELMKVEEQTVKVEMGLFVKESETFKVLKELESTKQVIDDLKLQIEKVTSECGNAAKCHADTMNIHPPPDIEGKLDGHTEPLIQSINTVQSPFTTLMKLNQAKAFLNMDTVKMFKCQIEEEKASLEKTRERLQLNMEKASALEAELSKTVAQLQVAKDPKPVLEPYDIWLQMKQLNAEKDKHRKMVEDSRLEIGELTSTIEHTRSKAKTLQFRIVMAEKLKEASRTGEAFALAEMGKRGNMEDPESATSDVTLSVEEHSKLVREAEESEVASRNRIGAAMQELDQANEGKLELLERVDEAMAAFETSRKVLEEALKREEAANKAKVAAEDALRRLRSDQIILNWRPTGNSNSNSSNAVKFKASATPTIPRKSGTGIYDVNGLSLVATTPKSTKAMSIGQILSMKLDCEFETAATGKKTAGAATKKKKVSLGQMLSQKYDMYSPMRIDHDGASRKQFQPRRRRLGFVVYALLLARQKHRKRQQARASSCSAKVV
ncbi:WEB family protein [Hordeum vulgare]|uniref:WEB family protein n=1 Tax=Hordeum vulgare subsp. vulgare TaxID=112509 RepID=A0A8I6WVB4_HORVV|nr:WEB family protein At2g38370-like isoform X1 [Hordeum vulgare subsp. vulgare]KAE8770507.1 WEB family protein [Hordeum vulgare]